MTSHSHYNTSTKVKIQGAIYYMQLKEILYKAEEVFKVFNVSHSAGFRMLNESSR